MRAATGQTVGLRRLVIVTVAASIGAAAVAVADPNLPNIPAHRHFVTSPSGGLVQVGPRLCDNLDSAGVRRAFNEFHSNIHFAVPGSPGPEQPAPGLHDGHSPDIVARACSFTAP